MRTLIYANDATIDDGESIDKSNEHYGQIEFVQHWKLEKRSAVPYFVTGLPLISLMQVLISLDHTVKELAKKKCCQVKKVEETQDSFHSD
ncbi:hypothetical protein LguiB_032029 [Lonicera macranthoides]